MATILKFHETKNYFLQEINDLYQEAIEGTKMDESARAYYDARLSKIQKKMKETLAVYLEGDDV